MDVQSRSESSFLRFRSGEATHDINLPSQSKDGDGECLKSELIVF
jgi:hypothetical protein